MLADFTPLSYLNRIPEILIDEDEEKGGGETRMRGGGLGSLVAQYNSWRLEEF